MSASTSDVREVAPVAFAAEVEADSAESVSVVNPAEVESDPILGARREPESASVNSAVDAREVGLAVFAVDLDPGSAEDVLPANPAEGELASMSGARRDPESESVRSLSVARGVVFARAFVAGADSDSPDGASAADPREEEVEGSLDVRRDPVSEAEGSTADLREAELVEDFRAEADAESDEAGLLADARASGVEELEAILGPGREPESDVVDAEAHDPVVEIDFAASERRVPVSEVASRAVEPEAAALDGFAGLSFDALALEDAAVLEPVALDGVAAASFDALTPASIPVLDFGAPALEDAPMSDLEVRALELAAFSGWEALELRVVPTLDFEPLALKDVPMSDLEDRALEFDPVSTCEAPELWVVAVLDLEALALEDLAVLETPALGGVDVSGCDALTPESVPTLDFDALEPASVPVRDFEPPMLEVVVPVSRFESVGAAASVWLARCAGGDVSSAAPSSSNN